MNFKNPKIKILLISTLILLYILIYVSVIGCAWMPEQAYFIIESVCAIFTFYIATILLTFN